MSAKRSFFLALVSAATVAGATACGSSSLTAPDQVELDRDLPVRDTSGFVPPPMNL